MLTYLYVYIIILGVLTAKPQVLRVCVDVDVETAEGLLTDQGSDSDDQWAALLNMYSRSVCPSDIAAITGYDGKSNALYFSDSRESVQKLGKRRLAV